eukprot:SAG31_NODE_22139_length_532_cov_14.438799_1_plen_114_part_01
MLARAAPFWGGTADPSADNYATMSLFTALVTAALEEGFAAVYELGFCTDFEGSPAKSPDQCNNIVGCTYRDSSCQLDTEETNYATKFADIMCMGDGTGEMLTGGSLTARYVTDR